VERSIEFRDDLRIIATVGGERALNDSIGKNTIGWWLLKVWNIQDRYVDIDRYVFVARIS
jgi:hypothetical protein